MSQTKPMVMSDLQKEFQLPEDWYQWSTAQKQLLLHRLQQRTKDARKRAELAWAYRFGVSDYIRNELGWNPWSEQQKIIDHYQLSLMQQQERLDLQDGRIAEADLEYWDGHSVIKNQIAVDACHNSGKTKLAAGLVSHFFDCHHPAIIYCFAPSADQINDLLFKELRVDRTGKARLLGDVLPVEPRIKYLPDHFVRGKATNNANRTGLTRAWGQHVRFMMFILDESEGVPDFIWEAIKTMASGPYSIILSLRNPRTTSSMAHQFRGKPRTEAFNISALQHPNVIEGRDVIPGAITREYVVENLNDEADGTEIVEEHDPEQHTFELPWDDSGTIYKPSPGFLWKILGVAPEGELTDVFCSDAAFRAAVGRDVDEDEQEETEHYVQYGVDAARYGGDYGTIYRMYKGQCTRLGALSKSDSKLYFLKIKSDLLQLIHRGGHRISEVYFRIDAGGGWGAGLADFLRYDEELMTLDEMRDEEDPLKGLEHVQVIEVNFEGVPYDTKSFANTVTEMYYHAGQFVRYFSVDRANETLIQDLSLRTYGWVTKRGRSVKALSPKKEFRDLMGRSPDDGDGFALAVAPQHVFINFVGGTWIE